MRMLELTGFNFCPHCGSSDWNDFDPKAGRCGACGFIYFHNTAAAAAVMIQSDAGIIFVRRSNPPKKGLLDLPGGFVDYAETAEAAVRREVWEELALHIGSLSYLGSFTNTYVYRKVTYYTSDIVFTTELEEALSVHSMRFDPGEVSEVVVARPADLDLDQVAFPSMRAALEAYLQLTHGNNQVPARSKRKV